MVRFSPETLITWPKKSKNNGLLQVVDFESDGHIDMAAKLAKPLRGNGELLKVVADFIQNTPVAAK
jgi:hypothetical protein